MVSLQLVKMYVTREDADGELTTCDDGGSRSPGRRLFFGSIITPCGRQRF